MNAVPSISTWSVETVLAGPHAVRNLGAFAEISAFADTDATFTASPTQIAAMLDLSRRGALDVVRELATVDAISYEWTDTLDDGDREIEIVVHDRAPEDRV